MTFSEPSDEAESFDFRSSRFVDDARALARATGLGLVACRQELFMAQGDMVLAHELLVSGYGAEPARRTFH